MYKSTPITKRAGSPFHNDLVDNNARMYQQGKKNVSIDIIGKSTKEGTKGTLDEIVKTAKPYVGAANDACSAEYIAKNGNSACEKYNALSDEKKDAANYDTTVIKGTDAKPDETNYSATELFRQDFGTNVGDVENREMNRVVKKAGKDVRRGTNKQSRIADKKAKFETKKGKDIEAGEKGYRKQQRLKAKETETANELRGFESRMDNALAGQASGKGLDERYRRADVAKTKGDYSDKVQLANADLERERDASLAKDVKRNSTSINFNTDFEQYIPAGMQNVKLKDYSKSFGAKNPVAMMKTPMKKNYFKK
jgi:hypothetical protein